MGLILKVGSRKYRVSDLGEGEVCLYSKDSNNSNKNRVTIKPDNTIEIKTADNRVLLFETSKFEYTDSDGNTITADSSGIAADGTLIKFGDGSQTMLKGTDTQTELTKEQVNMTALKAAFTAWVPVPNDGGAALKAALAAFLALQTEDYSGILSSKISGE